MSHARSPKFNPLHCLSWVWWHMSVASALEVEGGSGIKVHCKFEASLGHLGPRLEQETVITGLFDYVA